MRVEESGFMNGWKWVETRRRLSRCWSGLNLRDDNGEAPSTHSES